MINYKEEIIRLKKEKNALILAHNYQTLDVQHVADFVSDSYDLSVKARDAEQQTIVFCGVSFMADTAKILAPNKTILNPNPYACCPMAEMTDAEQLKALKKLHPNAAVICYINSSAEVKAESDLVVTSSNAARIADKLPADEIIFVPDQNLGKYVQRFTKKKIITADGFCYVHHRIEAQALLDSKKLHPKALVIVHPECKPEVVELADITCSTAAMFKHVQESSASEFIIGTEIGLVNKIAFEYPEKRFYSIGAPKVCVNMKKITVQHIYEALLNDQYKIELDIELMNKARRSLDRMIEYTQN